MKNHLTLLFWTLGKKDLFSAALDPSWKGSGRNLWSRRGVQGGQCWCVPTGERGLGSWSGSPSTLGNLGTGRRVESLTAHHYRPRMLWTGKGLGLWELFPTSPRRSPGFLLEEGCKRSPQSLQTGLPSPLHPGRWLLQGLHPPLLPKKTDWVHWTKGLHWHLATGIVLCSLSPALPQQHPLQSKVTGQEARSHTKLCKIVHFTTKCWHSLQVVLDSYNSDSRSHTKLCKTVHFPIKRCSNIVWKLCLTVTILIPGVTPNYAK